MKARNPSYIESVILTNIFVNSKQGIKIPWVLYVWEKYKVPIATRRILCFYLSHSTTNDEKFWSWVSLTVMQYVYIWEGEGVCKFSLAFVLFNKERKQLEQVSLHARSSPRKYLWLKLIFPIQISSKPTKKLPKYNTYNIIFQHYEYQIFALCVRQTDEYTLTHTNRKRPNLFYLLTTVVKFFHFFFKMIRIFDNKLRGFMKKFSSTK